jgi:UDP-N-acetylglucosamine diphosphorylase/glucosamine-1-phosphate N-acetyltransferase
MRVCIYEDRRVRDLEPLTLTRPVADLICGLTTLGQKQAHYFAAKTVSHLCRPVVADLIRGRDLVASVNDPTWLRAAPAILVNARWVPPSGTFSPLDSRRALIRSATPNPLADGPYLGTVKGEIAFAVLDMRWLQAVNPVTLDRCLDEWLQALPAYEVAGTLVSRLWELIELNAGQIHNDFALESRQIDAGFRPLDFSLVGPADRLLIHPSARIDPMVVADTTNGPVIIGANAVVHSFTRLEGPCAIGAGSILLGARIRAGTTIGLNCRIGGEVESSIVLGYTNKYHDGFLGHSYVGRWVNLAAATQTSDIRCDYEPVRVSLNNREIHTGITKVGAFIGDHVQTGIGVLLNCGTTIGPFARVLPTGTYAPQEIPAFHRYGPQGLKELKDRNRLLASADTMMRRRGKQLTPALAAVYRSIFGTNAVKSSNLACYTDTLTETMFDDPIMPDV